MGDGGFRGSSLAARRPLRSPACPAASGR
jgi:hypothetical protein